MRPLKNRFFGQCLRDTVSPWLSDWGRPGPILQPFEGFLLGPNCVPWRIVRCFSQNDKDFLHTGSQSGVALGAAVGSPPGIVPNVAVVNGGHDGNCTFCVWDRQGDPRPRSDLPCDVFLKTIKISFIRGPNLELLWGRPWGPPQESQCVHRRGNVVIVVVVVV